MAEQNDIGMAAVGRQFLRLATENEQLRSDLQKLVDMFNTLKTEHESLKKSIAGEKAAQKEPEKLSKSKLKE